jgi:hypothetical protein
MAKLRSAGTWRDLIALRPRTPGAMDGAGPRLEWRGRVGYPDGRRLRLSPAGDLLVDGGWRDAAGRWIRRTTFRYTLGRQGIRLSFRARRGDRIAYSVFSPAPQIAASSVTDRAVRYRLSEPTRIVRSTGYSSSADSQLVRATMIASVQRGGAIALTIGLVASAGYPSR